MIVGRDDVYGNELTGALSAELVARGAAVDTITYPARRVTFPDESAQVAAAAPDRVILASYTEGAEPHRPARGCRVPGRPDRRARRSARPPPGRADVPRRPDPGRRRDRHRHDRRSRPDGAPRRGPGAAGPDVLRRADVRLRDHARPGRDRVGVDGAGDDRAADPGRDRRRPDLLDVRPLRRAAGRRRGHRLRRHDGTHRDRRAGDISSARITTSVVIDGQLQPTATQDLDLVARRQQDIFASAVFVTQLQQALKVLGYFEGDITGVYDEATTAAVAALQGDLGLPQTGQFDEATDAALREQLGVRIGAFSASVAQLQQALADRGFYSGPIDGRYSAATIEAVRAFQRDLGVPETGVIDVATLQAIYARGITSGVASVPTTTGAAADDGAAARHHRPAAPTDDRGASADRGAPTDDRRRRTPRIRRTRARPTICTPSSRTTRELLRHRRGARHGRLRDGSRPPRPAHVLRPDQRRLRRPRRGHARPADERPGGGERAAPRPGRRPGADRRTS